ncbi:MAG: hypothetical protein WBW53_12600 [Terriglobales bacterium]
MKPRIRSTRNVLVALITVLVFSTEANSQAQKPAETARQEVPRWQQLLEEADAVSHDFSPEERADFLGNAALAAHGSPRLCEAFSLELFTIASTKLQPGRYRAAMQKNALVALSRVDPEKAASLFTKQDTPDMWNIPVPGEDFRAFGARTIFPALYSRKGMTAIPTIQSMAYWVGSTGEYPYRAVSEILNKISGDHSDTVDILVTDAIRFSGIDRHFLDQNKELTEFILSVQHQARSELLREAITLDLEGLDRESKDDKAPHHTIEATSSGSTVRFNSEPQYLAYRLLPVIRSLDPDWAGQVKKKYAVLANLPELSQGAQVTMVGAISFQDQQVGSTETSEALDQHRIMRAGMLAGGDPQAAAQIALQVSDAELRAIALADIAPAYMTVDAKRANSWIAESSDLLRNMPPTENKLRLMVSLAQAKASQGDTDAALDLMGKSFDLGEELFAQYVRANPGQMAYNATGMDELVDLTNKMCQKSALQASVIRRVETLREDTLKARLLVASAEGTEASG